MKILSKILMMQLSDAAPRYMALTRRHVQEHLFLHYLQEKNNGNVLKIHQQENGQIAVFLYYGIPYSSLNELEDVH